MELEIKLSPVTAAEGSKVFGDELIAPYLGEAARRDMESVYYRDTEGRLESLRAALRLRVENGTPVACLKIPTRAEGQAEVREEYEAEAADIIEGARLLADMEGLNPQAAEALRQGTFVPVCGNSFTRTEAEYRREGLAFVLSYDIGEYFKGDTRAPLGELEMELKEGEAERLNDLCAEIVARHGLTVCHTSKYQRAMELEERQDETAE